MPKNKLNKPLYPSKDHQDWSKLKSEIHNSATRHHAYREGEIYWFYFGNNVGVEEDGKNEIYSRPGLIVRGFSDALIWVVPLSHTKREGRYYYKFEFLDGISNALLSQMRPFDTVRIIRKPLGRISQETLAEIQARLSDIIVTVKDCP